MSDIVEREITQGIIPIGTPKAYKYDAALVESAKAEVQHGLLAIDTQSVVSQNAVKTLGDTIIAQIKNGYGYPFTASTSAAMTDTTKIYVYTGTTDTNFTNGHWYYYNGSVWADGGVYNSTAFETDKTLSVSGMAADAEETGAYSKRATLTPLGFNSTCYAKGDDNPTGLATFGTTTKMHVPAGYVNATPMGNQKSIWLWKLADEQLIPKLTISGGTMDSVAIIVTTNKEISGALYLSSYSGWNPSSTSVASTDIAFSVGTTVLKPTLTFRSDASSDDYYKWIGLQFDTPSDVTDIEFEMSVFYGGVSVGLMQLLSSVTPDAGVSEPLAYINTFYAKGSYSPTGYKAIARTICAEVPDGFISASAGTGTYSYFGWRLADKYLIPIITDSSGGIDSLSFYINSNKQLSARIHLSTSPNWSPATSSLICDVKINVGDNFLVPSLRYYTGAITSGYYEYLELEFVTPSDVSDFKLEIYAFYNDVKSRAFKNELEKISPSYSTEMIFWGDSLTMGAGGSGTTYCGVCANILNKTYKNCGVGGETENTISARQGGNNMIVPAGSVNGIYTVANMLDRYGKAIQPLKQGSSSDSVNPVVINGQSCTLTYDSDTNSYTISGYTGTLLSEVPALFNGSIYNAEITVIFVGQNGLGINTIDERISIIKSMLSKVGKKYVVMGISSGTETERAADDNRMLIEFGNHFFPTRKMLVNYGLAVQGITPTAQDNIDIANGTVPTSLRTDHVHLNADGYTALGKMLASFIVGLGYASYSS